MKRLNHIKSRLKKLLSIIKLYSYKLAASSIQLSTIDFLALMLVSVSVSLAVGYALAGGLPTP